MGLSPRVGIATPRPVDYVLVAFAAAVLIERIRTGHRDNYAAYGVRKMGHGLRRDGINIGREHTA